MNIEALSIEIFRPIDQLGWARAVAAVTSRISVSVERRKGPPDAGKDYALDRMALMFFQHLIDSIVLAIDRQKLAASSADGGHEEIAGGDQAFLVGKRNIGAAPGCSQRRGEARRADDGGHHPAGIAFGRFD